jgi:hypothetical protein
MLNEIKTPTESPSMSLEQTLEVTITDIVDIL